MNGNTPSLFGNLSTLCRGTILIIVFVGSLFGCHSGPDYDGGNAEGIDYRGEMRSLVIDIAEYADTVADDFIVIPQNGNELLTLNGEPDGPSASGYLSAIDGVGREDLLYGYRRDDRPTPPGEREYMVGFLDRAEQEGIEVLVTDYCTTKDNVVDSYDTAATAGYISFAAERDLASIPAYPTRPYAENARDIRDLSNAKNFLYLLDPGGFADRHSFLNALAGTNYDVLIIDLFDEYGKALTATEVSALSVKENGGDRLVLAYMSIGEAEDYRYYWDTAWSSLPPSWLVEENPNWPGNYKVRYWDESWKALLYGVPQAYLDRILAAGFDGVYLDIIDAFEFFESYQ